MSYFGGSVRDTTGCEDVMSEHSPLSDVFVQDDLLARLHDFPLVPGSNSLYTGKPSPVVYEDEDCMGKDGLSLSSLAIDTSEKLLGSPPSEEKDVDVTNDFLHASQILRKYLTLFSILGTQGWFWSILTLQPAFTRLKLCILVVRKTDRCNFTLLLHQVSATAAGEFLCFLSAFEALTVETSGSSPRTPFAQTPLSGSFRRFRSASSPSREPFDSLMTSGSLHRVPSSASSLASDSSHPVLRHPGTLRRTASERSDRPPPLESQYTSLQSDTIVPSSTVLLPSHHSSITCSYAAERLARGSAHRVTEPEATYSHPTSGSNSLVLDAPRSRCGSMSSDELLGFREFLARRAEDVLLESRNLAASPISNQDAYGFDDVREDAASDLAEYGDSTASGRYSGFHRHDTISDSTNLRYPADHDPYSHPIPVSTALESLDGKSAQEHLLHALSIIRAEREQVASNGSSPLTRGNAFFDLRGGLPPPALPLRSESSPCGGSYTSLLKPRDITQPGVSDFPSATATALTSPEKKDSLSDFLDLSPDIDSPRLTTDNLPSFGGSVSLFPVHEGRLTPVPEGAAAGPSGMRNPKRVGGDPAGPVLGKSPTPLVVRRVRSAAELAPSRHQYVRPLAPDQNYSQPQSTRSDLQYSDPYSSRAYHQASPVRTVLSTGEIMRGSYARWGYDTGTGSLAEHGELAYRQNMEEPNGRQHGGSYGNKLAQDLQPEGSQHRKLGRRTAVDSAPPRELVSREGPVSQRRRARTLQDIAESAPPPRDRRRRSSSLTLSPPSFHGNGECRYRTLNDRAFRHPDVPCSPLLSDYVPSPRPADGFAHSPSESFSGNDIHDHQASSPEIGVAPLSISGDYSQSEVHPPKAFPQPPTLRPRLFTGPTRNNSYPLREPPSHISLRHHWSSLDLWKVPSSTTGLPSTTQGIGLSTVDNGAFEAPRPAPAPSPHSGRAAAMGPSVYGGGKAGSPAKRPADDARRRGVDLGLGRSVASNRPKRALATPDPYSVRSASPLSFGGLTFSRPAWSKKQKLPGRSGSSTPDLMSLTSVLEHEEKPQRKGLFFKRRT
ncbi:hypothetical protein BJV78DRAFT_1278663 [Lactifluus subvellereus]|nr:hypothetical protein BJV78DRAFT_1278663 [Lactifluus subvellereus]